MKNKEQFKRILNLAAAIIIILIFTLGFSHIWYNYYNKIMRDPFWRKGNILLIILYAVSYACMTVSFNGFRLGYERTLGLFGSQVLSIVGSNTIAFVIVSLIGRGRLSVMPMIVLTLLELAVALVWSIVFTRIYNTMYPPRRLIIVYGNKNASMLVSKMSQRTDKYTICAAISCDESLKEIKKQILKYEGVIISDIPNDLRNKIVKFTFEHSIRTYINPKLSDIIVRGADNFTLFDTPLLLARNQGLKFEQKFLKRLFDIVCSALALVVLSPFMLITALAIKLYDGGPVFYSQERLTLGGKVFNVLKFRSMIVNAEKNGARLAGKEDSRITPVGKIIRKLRIDELPQLINIFKGDMSFVGPRPERPELAAKYEKNMPEFKYRLKVKAGLTGYAQIMGKYNTTPYDKLKMDLMYIENQSLWEDLKIVIATVRICFVPDATEGVESSGGPVETVRNRIGHDSSIDAADEADRKITSKVE